jgi:CheY-like chemotaxis protein
MKNKVVLIIDDDPIFVFVIQKLFFKIGGDYKIDSIKNGQFGLDHIEELFHNNQQFPDVILLDLNMPILDGWQFLDEVETKPYKDQLNIYLTSSTIDPLEHEKARLYKTVKRFVMKPISIEDLESILRGAY